MTQTAQKPVVTQKVAIASLTIDKKYQMRLIGVAEETIEQYCMAMEQGAVFPPVVAHRVPDGRLILTDGWHRTTAHKQLGRATIEAVIHEGTEKEAYDYARFTANRTNGLRLTRSDLQALCEAVIQDPEYQCRTDLELSRLIGCSDKTIAAARKRLGIYPTMKVSGDGRIWTIKGDAGTETTLNRQLPAEGPEAPADGGRGTLATKVVMRLKEHLDDLGRSLQKLDAVIDGADAEEVGEAALMADAIAEYASALMERAERVAAEAKGNE